MAHRNQLYDPEIVLPGATVALVTANCAIYSKAQHMEQAALLDGKVTMKLSGMLLNMAYIASIGKLYGDGSLLMYTLQGRQYSGLKGRGCREETGVCNSCQRPCIDYIKKRFGSGCNNAIRQIF